MRKVTVAMVQTESRLLDKRYNLDRAELLIRRAAVQGADIVCLPELFASGYYLPALAADLDSLCEEKDGETVSRLCGLAAELGVYICAGVMVKDGSGGITNSSVFINDDGTVQLFYTKNHMFGDEGKYFISGSEYKTADTRFGKVGIIICYDNNFPESARINAIMGAELILCPCAWRAQERDIFKLLSCSHACENTVFFCAVNMCGRYNELELFGGSILSDPRGRVLAECGGSEEVSCCEIDLDDVLAVRKNLPFLSDRKPAIYKKITECGSLH